MDIADDYVNYHEYQFKGRMKLIYNWIDNCNTLLDCGCAYGYGTKIFSTKSKETWGIDISVNSVNIAQNRYAQIKFLICESERTPFKDGYFDVIILSEIIEHTVNEVHTLNEIYRILKNNGSLILTTPQKGLFSFMDPLENIYILNKYMPLFYKLACKIAENKFNKKISGFENEHKHFSIKNIEIILNNSKFRNNYKIVKIHRGGLFMGVFLNNLQLIMNLMFGKKRALKLLKPLLHLKEKDYWIGYGFLSYHMGLKLIKNEKHNLY
jgi:ubiquinone/menaquinone biosynthesis C-methylase UbiE